MLRIGPGLHYLGSFSSVAEALEAWNNAAYYLNHCGRGLRIPLQGTDQDISRYTPPQFIKPEEHDQYVPAPTEKTLGVVAWAEKNMPQVEEVQIKAAAVPSAFLQSVKGLNELIDAAQQDCLKRLAALREQTLEMARRLDPAEQALETEHKNLLEWVNRNSGDEMRRGALEDFYTQHPHSRPR